MQLRRRLSLAPVLCLAAALAGGCVCARPHPQTQPQKQSQPQPQPSEPGKTFATAGPILGDLQIRPSRCLSGGHATFLGADAYDEQSGWVVRAVRDAVIGTVVRVFYLADWDHRTVVFHPADCQRFIVKIQDTGSWVNGVDLVGLTLDVDCRNGAGDAVVGTYTADECE